jgi:hypothetical protein
MQNAPLFMVYDGKPTGWFPAVGFAVSGVGVGCGVESGNAVLVN